MNVPPEMSLSRHATIATVLVLSGLSCPSCPSCLPLVLSLFLLSIAASSHLDWPAHSPQSQRKTPGHARSTGHLLINYVLSCWHTLLYACGLASDGGSTVRRSASSRWQGDIEQRSQGGPFWAVSGLLPPDRGCGLVGWTGPCWLVLGWLGWEDARLGD